MLHHFDEDVLQSEIARDRERTGRSRIVETWHPGNLAWARMRPLFVNFYATNRLFDEKSAVSSSRYEKAIQSFTKATEQTIVVVQPLSVSKMTLLKRRRNDPSIKTGLPSNQNRQNSEDDIREGQFADLLLRIGQEARIACQELDLCVLPVLCTDDLTVEGATDIICSQFNRVLKIATETFSKPFPDFKSAISQIKQEINA